MVEAVQGVGNMVAGIAGYSTGKASRKVAQVNATEAERDGAAQEAQIRDAARLALGEQSAAQFSNGFQGGTGSAIDALGESQINATLAALQARREAASRARAIRLGGEYAYSAGKNAMVQGAFGAASSFTSQASDWAAAKKGGG